MLSSVFAWILTLYSVVANAVVLTNAPEHTLKKCHQDEIGNIHCEEFQQDETEKISYWPPGPYVLPMTRYGCPESSMQGWREGFIRLAWKEPREIQIISNFSTIELFDNTSATNWLPKKHQLFLPTTLNSITLYFCYKHRKNATLDQGVWPDGNYSIYKTEEECPPDFENHSTNITVPVVSWWVSDGYLPDFDITTDDFEGLLQIKLCSSMKSSNKSFANDERISDQVNPLEDATSVVFRNWTHYFLIKNKNASCPIFSSTVMFEESIYIEIGQSQNMYATVMELVNTLCFYNLTTGYSVTITSITKGKTESPPDYEKYPYFKGLSWQFKIGIYLFIHHWRIADLGRTIPVSAVEITTVWSYRIRTSWHPPFASCISHDITCFISSGKWNFLQSEALSCLYSEYCRVMGTSLSLVFKRVMEGRYVTLIHQEAINIFRTEEQHFFYTIKVFTEVISYDPKSNCNADLGMQNFDIEYDQISASSWLPDFAPSFSRPYLWGWCPQLDDPQPYIKVKFPRPQSIEGITVYNSLEVILIQDMETIVLFGSAFITFIYSEKGNDTTNSKILRIDSSKLTTEAHTFWFMKAIRAKMVMLFPEKTPTFDLTCLRFEILGCKQNASYDKFYIRERQVPPFESVGFVSEIFTYNSLLSSALVPDSYQDSQLYKWIIQFPEFHFIKLIFTLLSFTKAEMLPDDIRTCNDSVIISRDLADISPSTSRVIDRTFHYGRSLSIETKESLIVITFSTCPMRRLSHRSDGFKVIAAYEDIPTCFSINGRLDWKEGSYETCRHTSMFITSLSYLGFSLLSTTEQWDIIVPTQRISLRFVEFHVPCKIEDEVSFVIKDKGSERFFCNTNKPADILNSSSDEITVIFNRGIIKSASGEPAILIGVKLFYSLIEGPGKPPVDYRDNKFSKDVINAPHRVAERSYSTYWKVSGAVLDDNTVFHEAPDLFLQDCFTTSREQSVSWWLVDLLDVFIVEYIVLFRAVTISSSSDYVVSITMPQKS